MQIENVSEDNEVTRAMARFVAKTRYDQLPQNVSDIIKKSILDTIGVIIPASMIMPGIKEVMDLVIGAGGKEESTILSYGVKVPCWTAAFANGVRGHALDYGDGHLEAVFRVGCSVVPPALAVAERVGKVSGRDFITAVAVGEEVLCRLGVAVARRRQELGPWHCGVLLGYFGATASASKLLELNEEGIDRAFGIAFLQAGGTLGVTSSESNLRGMYPGFVGQTGVLAALMAEKGILGPRGCLGSRYGLFDVYFHGEYDREALVDNLGKEFEVAHLSFKPWPACAFAHPYIDAMLGIISEYHLTPEDIREIDVFSGEICQELCEPIDIDKGRVPSTTNEAKRSIPFSVAVAALKGKVSCRDFTPEGLRDTTVLKMAQKVKLILDPELDDEKFTKKGNQLPPGKVQIKSRQGETYAKRVEFPYGHHLNPMTTQDLVKKFRDCVSFSPKPISEKNVEQVIEGIMHLEEVTDIEDILRLMG